MQSDAKPNSALVQKNEIFAPRIISRKAKRLVMIGTCVRLHKMKCQ